MCYRSRHIKRGPATLISSIAWQIPPKNLFLQMHLHYFSSKITSWNYAIWKCTGLETFLSRLSSVSLDPYQLILSRTFLDSAGNDSMHDIWRTGPIFSDDLDSLPNSGRSNNYSSRPRSITSALPLMTSNWLGALDFLQKPRSRELLWAKKCWSFNLTELPA